MAALRILYVEDDPDIRSIATMAMQSLGGFTVQECTSGNEALARAAAFQPQLILMDVMMPGINGPETLKKLREIPATAATPVIFMTAKVQASEIREYKALGAIDVISKPFDPLTLATQIASLWEEYCDKKR